MNNKPNEVLNIFSKLPEEKLPKELFETLLKNKNIKLERIISTGQITPKNEWYDQAYDEWIILLKGVAKILFEDNAEISLKSGDYLLIPAHQKHRVSWTDPNDVCVWLALHIQR